ncbi:hypothetical protein [Streptomyces sp. NBC_01304]|nr:hypothetical protein OG430_23935 [Streptomyces sp. NBC_01304]
MSEPAEHLDGDVPEYALPEGPTPIDNPLASADDTGMIPGEILPPPLWG